MKMSNPDLTRLIVDYEQMTPDNQVLSFTGVTGVANYFGLGSYEYDKAVDYFSNHIPGSVLEFARWGQSQRSHLIGANFEGSLAQLRDIKGPISFTFDGYVYSRTVSLAGVSSLASAAALLTSAFAQNAPTVARMDGATITPVTTSFIGHMTAAWVLSVDSAPTSPIEIGGKFWGTNINPKDSDANQAIIQHSGLDGGAGVYTTFSGNGYTPGEYAMTETYGVLYAPNVSGSLQAGERLVGSGVPKETAILQQLDAHHWLVNNAFNDSVVNLRATPPSMQFTAHTAHGATETQQRISLQPNGMGGFNYTPASLSFASGPVADLLGLSQGYGAVDSVDSGAHPTGAQWFNEIMHQASGEGQAWGSWDDGGGRAPVSLKYAASHTSLHYVQDGFLHTTPAGTY
jgi:hypothetical protein